MKYMMFVTTDPETAADETGEGTLDIETWVNTYDAAGKRSENGYGQSRTRRRCVDAGASHGDRWPVCGVEEWIVGFDILECRDLDEAIEIAAQHPNAASGRLELRPFWPFEDEAG